MLSSFLTFINDEKLFFPEQKILLAVSGGRDSMLMLDLFSRAGFNFEVAHCNFGLRGEASDGDEQFVKNYCEKRAVGFYAIRFNTAEVAESRGISTQMAARELRYAWFEEVRASEGFDCIATAHHLNDRLETLLLNVVKGTGPKGLRSIPVKSGNIIRPLLFARSEDITGYLVQHGIDWREDESNTHTDYQRNKIRLEVIPLLKTINPSLEETAGRNLARFDDLADIFEEKLKDFEAQYIVEEEDGWRMLAGEMKKTAGLPLILEEWLKPFGFNYAVVQDLLAVTTPGKYFDSGSYRLTIGRAFWMLAAKSLKQEEVLVEDQTIKEVRFGMKRLSFRTMEVPLSSEELRQSNRAFLDMDKLAFPLTIRYWKQGDSFQPFGMKGTRKVSDFLTDLKKDRFEKENQVVISDQKGIVWLAGLRIDHRCRITEQTGSVLRISFE